MSVGFLVSLYFVHGLGCSSRWLGLWLSLRLVEESFTVDEVSEVLSGLQAVVYSEVESELINTAHTNVLLLRQLFSQAEKWYLKLQTDISELENRYSTCVPAARTGEAQACSQTSADAFAASFLKTGV